MVKTIHYCDVCGKEDAKSIYFTIGRQPDPAGQSEDIQEAIDLCGDHSFTALQIANGYLSHADRIKLCDRLNSIINARSKV